MMWTALLVVIREAGPGLVAALLTALRDGDADRAAQNARVVAETVAFKRALRAARR